MKKKWLLLYQHLIKCWSSLQKSRHTLVLLLLLFVAIVLRAINFDEFPFNFDQIQIEQNARLIASGDPALIGPRTGPAAMSTGPLIYYIAAPLSYLVEPGYTPVFTAIVLSAITGILMLILVKKYCVREHQLVLFAMWAVSPFLVGLDRVPWNPNLSVLASSLVFFPLIHTKKLSLFDCLLISAGVFLGYQAHFSGLLLLPLAGLSLIIRWYHQRFPLWYFVLPGFAFVVSLLPTVLFDMRNNWLNYRGFIGLVGNRDQVSVYLLAERCIHKCLIVLETLGKIMWQGNALFMVLMSSVIGLLAWIKKSFPFHQYASQISGLWLLLVPLAFSAYRESTPEYYFLILTPVFLTVLSTAAQELDRYKWVLLSLCIGYGIMQSYTTGLKGEGLSVGRQKQALVQIQTLIAQQNEFDKSIANLHFDIKPIEALGLQYLIKVAGITTQAKGDTLHIMYPVSENTFYTHSISDQVKLILDTTDTTTSTSLKLLETLLVVPNDWSVITTLSSGRSEPNVEIIDDKEKKRAHLIFLSKMTNVAEIEQLKIESKGELPVITDTKIVSDLKNNVLIINFEPGTLRSDITDDVNLISCHQNICSDIL